MPMPITSAARYHNPGIVPTSKACGEPFIPRKSYGTQYSILIKQILSDGGGAANIETVVGILELDSNFRMSAKRSSRPFLMTYTMEFPQRPFLNMCYAYNAIYKQFRKPGNRPKQKGAQNV
jgi:hypothetical protein